MAGVVRILLGGLLMLTGIVFFVTGTQGFLSAGLFGLFYFIPGLILAVWGLGAAGITPRLDVTSWFTKVGTKRILFGIFCVFLGFVIILGGISGGLIWVLLGIPFLVWGLWAKTKSVQSQKKEHLFLQQLTPVQQQLSQPTHLHASFDQLRPVAQTAPRYCPICGQSDARESADCVRCGKPLPPPP